MRKFQIIVAASLFCVLNLSQTQAKSDGKAGVPTVIVTNLDMTGKTLDLSYVIRNHSDHDIWLCEGIAHYLMGFEIGMAEDGQTLLVSRRLTAQKGVSGAPLSGRYVRVRAGESRKESVLLSLPVSDFRVLRRFSVQPYNRILYAKRLVIELGWYEGDLPDRVFSMLDKAERGPRKKRQDDWGIPLDVIAWLGGSVRLNKRNEHVPDRNERFVVPWTDQTLKGEQVLRLVVEDVNVPYMESARLQKFKPENIELCTKIEMTFQPSILEYLFTYPNQQNLLNAEEVKYLRSQEKVLIDDRQLIKGLTDEVSSKGVLGGQMVTERSKKVTVICYNQDETLTSFTVYDDRSIVTEEGLCFWYAGGLRSMRTITSQIPQAMPFGFRIECAQNLRNLWRRLRLYHKAKQMTYTGGVIKVAEPIPPEYPNPDEWGDSLVRAYVPLAGKEAYLSLAHKCPTEGSWKLYAINPNCKPNSLADMVLLFEANSGWNKYGDPGLFTFDNHDPKGGCVLLNDGTVKFIRTEDELRQLRWK